MTNTNTADIARPKCSSSCFCLHTTWWQGDYAVERKCECKRCRAGLVCSAGNWHVVTSSSDLADARAHAVALAPHGTYRVVLKATGAVVS